MSRTVHIEDDILLAYTTPILARVVPDHQGVNKILRTLILECESAAPGLKKSNIGGWHSDEDFLQWDSESVRSLQHWFAMAIKSINDFSIGPDRSSGDLDASAWANVCRRGDYHQPHFHPNNDWSGVYYVATGNDGSESGIGGRIDMLDPRAGVGMMHTPGLPYTGTVQFQPEAGMMLVFPSWLVHYVHPHDGPDERISIALNARMVSDRPVQKIQSKRCWFSRKH